MTIEDVDRVDSITRTPDGRTYTLLMTEERLFDDSDTQFRQLVEKINGYVAYLQSGQFHAEYPAARGHTVRVRLVCRNEPAGERFRTLLGAATVLFGRHGADFLVEILPTELLGRGPGGLPDGTGPTGTGPTGTGPAGPASAGGGDAGA